LNRKQVARAFWFELIFQDLRLPANKNYLAMLAITLPSPVNTSNMGCSLTLQPSCQTGPAYMKRGSDPRLVLDVRSLGIVRRRSSAPESYLLPKRRSSLRSCMMELEDICEDRFGDLKDKSDSSRRSSLRSCKLRSSLMELDNTFADRYAPLYETPDCSRRGSTKSSMMERDDFCTDSFAAAYKTPIGSRRRSSGFSMMELEDIREDQFASVYETPTFFIEHERRDSPPPLLVKRAVLNYFSTESTIDIPDNLYAPNLDGIEEYSSPTLLFKHRVSNKENAQNHANGPNFMEEEFLKIFSNKANNSKSWLDL